MSALDYWNWITARGPGQPLRILRKGCIVYYLSRAAGEIFEGKVVKASAGAIHLDCYEPKAKRYFGDAWVNADPTHVYDVREEAERDLFKLKLEGKTGGISKSKSNQR